MTKEEMKQEAEKYFKNLDECKTKEMMIDAYITGAEQREKRIAELERNLEQTEKELADYQFNYQNIKELQKENEELKAQIEKMKCCENCRWEEPSSFCDGCKRLKGQIFSDIITSDNWELRRY